MGMKERIIASKIVRTPYGKIDLKATASGLFELSLRGRLRNDSGSHSLLDRLQLDLERYFEGRSVDFTEVSLDMSGYSLFELSVLNATKRIPYGETRSYREIAEYIGRPSACRAVGRALRKNRTPIVIPCHRIIQSDSSLGGFGAGIGWKKRLLELEGIL